MDTGIHSPEVDPKYLLGQLSTARKEINNLRQQVKNLRHILDKDVDGIKQAIGTYANERNASLTPNCVAATNDNGEEAGSSTQTDDFLKLKPIGIIKTGFPSKRGTPRQPTICKTACGKVTLFNSIFTNPEHALIGLQDFSHMWILFHFHRNDSTHVRAKVAPPRLNGARTGVFSTRSPHRPCPIGLSLVKIVKIDCHEIYFEGVDMVDQTPVLDIKPYIPQYDNPLHIEKMITSRPTREDGSNGADYPQDLAQDGQTDETTTIVDSGANRASLSNSSMVMSLDFNGDTRDEILWDCCRSSVEANGEGESCTRIPSTSRDEEIALRLQAEEFEASPNFEDYGSRNYFSSSEVSAEGTGLAGNTARVVSHANVETTGQSLERNLGSLVLETRNSTARVVASNTGSVNTESPNSGARIQQQEDDYPSDSEMPRNSRLLDGADGPSTVCGTDMDLIHRRALNSRPDNSPVRMGVREAPDGEEGLESQPLTPSQTVANIHGITSAPVATLVEAANPNSNAESRETRAGQISNFRSESGAFEVRVPEWISRPRTNALSVVFNERALSQLNEILNGKADEQKNAIESVLGQDPRSVYLRQRWGNQFYTFLIHDLHISCRFDDNRGVVTVFQVRHAGRTCECGEPEWQCLGHSPLS